MLKNFTLGALMVAFLAFYVWASDSNDTDPQPAPRWEHRS